MFQISPLCYKRAHIVMKHMIFIFFQKWYVGYLFISRGCNVLRSSSSSLSRPFSYLKRKSLSSWDLHAICVCKCTRLKVCVFLGPNLSAYMYGAIGRNFKDLIIFMALKDTPTLYATTMRIQQKCTIQSVRHIYSVQIISEDTFCYLM
jgi:hypothetical protein